jgi:hypothetical protein
MRNEHLIDKSYYDNGNLTFEQRNYNEIIN